MKSILLLASCLCIALNCYTQNNEKTTSIGVKIGGFIPNDYQIQGSKVISFNEFGSQSGVSVYGFGNGLNILLEGIYYFSDWGIKIESGIRIHNKHKIDLNHTSGNDTYDNSLFIVPVNIGAIYKLPVNSNTEIYISPSIGYYYGEIKQLHTRTDLSNNYFQTEINGTNSSIGFNILAGLQFPIYYDLILGFDISYSVIQSNWDLKNIDDNTEIESSLNTGGVAINLGIKYRF